MTSTRPPEPRRPAPVLPERPREEPPSPEPPREEPPSPEPPREAPPVVPIVDPPVPDADPGPMRARGAAP